MVVLLDPTQDSHLFLFLFIFDRLWNLAVRGSHHDLAALTPAKLLLAEQGGALDDLHQAECFLLRLPRPPLLHQSLQMVVTANQ